MTLYLSSYTFPSNTSQENLLLEYSTNKWDFQFVEVSIKEQVDCPKWPYRHTPQYNLLPLTISESHLKGLIVGRNIAQGDQPLDSQDHICVD